MFVLVFIANPPHTTRVFFEKGLCLRLKRWSYDIVIPRTHSTVPNLEYWGTTVLRSTPVLLLLIFTNILVVLVQ
jgi:hypothetical protein